MTWAEVPEPELPPPGPAGTALALLRGVPLALVTFSGLGLLLMLRLIERPIWGQRRPITPFVTQAVCRCAFGLLGISYQTLGTPLTQPGAIVANHASWLDIFALNAAQRIYFVSKAEVASWPGIGWLARATGTVFIRRNRGDAAAQAELFRQRLGAGHRLLFFPEGTSSDGQRVLPFKPTLFAAFFDPSLRDRIWVQPVTVHYAAPQGRSARLYGWWGDMPFGAHLLTTLAARPQGQVTVIHHTPLKVSDFPDRKALASRCEHIIRTELSTRIGQRDQHAGP